MQKIATSIRALRQKSQMTQTQLADDLGVQHQTVSKWENGTTIPDTAMLPRIADYFNVSLDELFGRNHVGCRTEIPEQDTDFLLQAYAQMYAPEAGPWNLSVANKYLEYRFADFFENNFRIPAGAAVCNIGIGAGMWDTYLSYRLNGGSLTSIDKLSVCCQQLERRLCFEGNPNSVKVICEDVMLLNMDEQFEIVTMVGSTLEESGVGLELLKKAMCFLKPGGSLYYQSLDEKEDSNDVLKMAFHSRMRLSAFLEENAYGFTGRYYKFVRE